LTNPHKPTAELTSESLAAEGYPLQAYPC
jgi:hypothetical protein